MAPGHEVVMTDYDLLKMTNEQILDSTDALQLSKLNALTLRQLLENLNGCPARCWQNYWVSRGLLVAVGIIATLLTQHLVH